MSSTFSFSRLGKLITKQLFENARLYMYSVLALFGLLSAVFTFWFEADGPAYNEEATYLIFLFGLYLAGSIFSSMAFSMLGSRHKGIYWLSIPATHLEKLVCTIFYSTIVFTVVYCLVYYVVKSLAISLLQGYVASHPGTSYREMKSFDGEFGEILRYLIYAYFGVQALYLLGSVYFRRYSFIVTTVASGLIIFVFAYYIWRIQEGMFSPHNWSLVSVIKRDASVTDGYLLYSISPTLIKVYEYIIQFAWAPLFWIITWFRLKEKEI